MGVSKSDRMTERRTSARHAATGGRPSATRRGLRLACALALLSLAGCYENEPGPELGPITVNVFPVGGPAYTTADLVATAWANHPVDYPPPTFTYSWTVDGVDAGVATSSVPSSMTAKYQVWEVTATAEFDATSVGPDLESIVIINSPPTVEINRLKPDPDCPIEPLVITATPDDADGDSVTISYQWFVNNVQVTAVTGDTLDCQYFTIDDRVYVNVRADDGEDIGPLERSNQVTIREPADPAMAALAPSADDDSPRSESNGVTADRPGSSSITVEASGPSALSLTEWNVCRLRSDASLECTGLEDHALTLPPGGRFTRVDAAPDFACAIRLADGGAVCWGEPIEDFGQLAPPEGAFVEIAVGATSACALRADGRIACWGDDALGQASPPEGEFVQLELSDTYGCAVEKTGGVLCWGLDE